MENRLPYETLTIAERIKDNPYVGRGIIMGISEDGEKAVSAYFIMGRSENSRNRVFRRYFNDIMIKPFDDSKVEDPSLIIYFPVRTVGKTMIVTNGDQTDTIRDFLEDPETCCCGFESALMTRTFEPDGPNWTPRISAVMDMDTETPYNYKMSILKSADPEGTATNRYFFNYEAVPGIGHFIHTYNTDGNPIPTFTGEPERISIPNDILRFTNEIWDNLNEANKISLYVCYTDMKTGQCIDAIVNKHEQE
ncbi:MAG: IMP cyclohydrolase [Eubacterium sp.]|nr:IMP cyclohydrolase [Eubacterium sp.]